MASTSEKEPTIFSKTSNDGKFQAEWFEGYGRAFGEKLEDCKVSNILTMYSLDEDKKTKLFELPLNRYQSYDPCVAFLNHPKTGKTVFTCNVFMDRLQFLI